MELKNVSKLLALAIVVNGCVTRENVVHHYETKVIKPDGTEEVKHATCAGNEPEFTFLGNVWNGATYGIVGCGYGAYFRCQEGISSTNNIPVVGPVVNGLWGFTSGSVEGLYKGAVYGTSMKYGEGSTVEEVVADQIQTNATKVKDFAQRYIGD